MQLILWRHAQAEEGDSDLARPLTAKGHKQARKMARFLQGKLSGSYHVWTSEAERSRQTAAYLQHPAKVQAALNPDAAAQQVAEWLCAIASDETVVIVGHQPWLGDLCAWLLTQTWQNNVYWSVKKGAVWWFECVHPLGSAPAQLRLRMTPAEIECSVKS